MILEVENCLWKSNFGDFCWLIKSNNKTIEPHQMILLEYVFCWLCKTVLQKWGHAKVDATIWVMRHSVLRWSGASSVPWVRTERTYVYCWGGDLRNYWSISMSRGDRHTYQQIVQTPSASYYLTKLDALLFKSAFTSGVSILTL